MSEPFERLQSVRRKAGYDDATSAAKAFGWNENTYRSHENGERGLRPDVAKRYAAAFKTTAAFLLTGQGGAEPRNIVPLMGKIGAGGQILAEFEQVPEGGLDEIETILPLPEGSIAFKIDGTSMWPKYDPDDVIICLKDGSPVDRVIGFYGAVLTEDGRRFLKRIIKGGAKGTYDLESLNADPIRGVRLKWVSEIIASFPAQQWRSLEGKSGRHLAKAMAKRTG